MDYLISQRPNVFHNIPRKKLDLFIDDLSISLKDNPIGLSTIIQAFTRYWESNIPVDYWMLQMDDFKGPKPLVDIYNLFSKDINIAYKEGFSYCFAGPHGVGKSMTCACILKSVVESGKFTGLYVNLTDIISVLTSKDEDKNDARRLLLEVDFLVIDEVDQRFMGTDNAIDLFGRLLEPTIRTRIQNRMPIIICTNSPDVVGGFNGALKNSLKSLMKELKTVSILGDDFRGKKGATK